MRIVLFGATGMPGSRIAVAVGSMCAPPRNPVAGGAGSPDAVPDAVPGEGPCEQPGFPAAYRAKAPALDRTPVSPAAGVGPGERTGGFRVDGDRLPTDVDGDRLPADVDGVGSAADVDGVGLAADVDGTGRISAEDHAAAFVDALERGARVRARMPVAH